MGTVVSSIFLCEEVTHIKRRLTWALRPCLPVILNQFRHLETAQAAADNSHDFLDA